MDKKIISLICATVSLIHAASPVSFQSHYISLGTQDTSWNVAADAAGDIFVVSYTVSQSNSTQVRITKTDPSGKVVAVMDLGQGAGAFGAATDAQGNLYIADTASHLNANNQYIFNGLVTKVDNRLSNVIATWSFAGGAASAVATDASGNVWVTGWAGTGFPANSGAPQSNPTPGALYAAVAELSPDLSTVMHSTLYGSTAADCNPDYDACRQFNGSSLFASTVPTAIAIDPSGAVIIAGYTNGTPAQLDSSPYNYGFVAKFSPDLSSVLGEAAFNPGKNDREPTYFRAVAIDPQGNVVLGGATSYAGSLPGTLQPNSPTPDGGGFVLKYDAALQNLLWGTFFGASTGGSAAVSSGGVSNGYASVNGVAIDSQGDIWITGMSQLGYLPNSTSSPMANLPFVAELSPDGTEVLNLVSSQFGGEAVTMTPNDGVAVLGWTDSFLLSGPPDQPALLTVANSANNQSSGTIAPIELISLFGTGIGPTAQLSGEVIDGAFTTSLGGYQVLFNGVPAPLLCAGPNQINVVSPAAIASQVTADIEVVGPSRSTAFPTVFVAAVRPQIFLQPGPFGPAAVAYNQDGTLNSASNAAPEGSIVTIWATGTGLAGNPLPDGTIAAAAGATLNLPVLMAETNVLYAGQAPGAVQGLTQINFQVPARPFVFGPVESSLSFQQGNSTTVAVALEITIGN